LTWRIGLGWSTGVVLEGDDGTDVVAQPVNNNARKVEMKVDDQLNDMGSLTEKILETAESADGMTLQSGNCSGCCCERSLPGEMETVPV
jgi:hypothetical protein